MTILLGDCRAGMRYMPENSVDSIVTDPPYGLSKQPNMREVLKHWLAGDDYKATGSGFMGKSWDSFVPGPATWAEAYRILKPGGIAAVFAGSRTVDLMATSLRLAGFEIFDMGHWLYGSGFPKSLDVSKHIDARDKLEPQREQQYAFTRWIRDNCTLSSTGIDKVLGTNGMGRHYTDVPPGGKQPEIAVREHFEALRPHFKTQPPIAIELAVAARTVESENLKRRSVKGKHEDPSQASEWRANVTGSKRSEPQDITGAYSAEAKRWEGFGTALKPCHEPIIFARKPLDGTYANNIMTHGCGALNIDGCRVPFASPQDEKTAKAKNQHEKFESGARNNAVYGKDTADRKNYDPPGRWPGNVWHDGGLPEPMATYFYCAKASKADREAGLESFNMSSAAECTERTEGSDGLNSPRAGAGRTGGSRNTHPTVKPTELMRWLVRLVTPPGGLCSDPFVGSGSTPRACALEGFPFIGWEIDPDYHAIGEARSCI
jgi:DNA modification methylase